MSYDTDSDSESEDLCELCDVNVAVTRCKHCNDGRICYDCLAKCDECDNEMCLVCMREWDDVCRVCSGKINP